MDTRENPESPFWTFKKFESYRMDNAKTVVVKSVQFNFRAGCDTLNSTKEYHYGKTIYR